MSPDHDPYRDVLIVTPDQLETLPEGLYLVGDEHGVPVRREVMRDDWNHVPLPGPRLLARVRRFWARATPTAMQSVRMRRDGLQIVQQWEDRDGGWPEEVDAISDARGLEPPPPDEPWDEGGA